MIRAVLSPLPVRHAAPAGRENGPPEAVTLRPGFGISRFWAISSEGVNVWITGLRRVIALWGMVGAVALGVIVTAYFVDWVVRELFRWVDFRAIPTQH